MVEQKHTDLLQTGKIHRILAVIQNFQPEPSLIGFFAGKCQLRRSFFFADGIRAGRQFPGHRHFMKSFHTVHHSSSLWLLSAAWTASGVWIGSVSPKFSAYSFSFAIWSNWSRQS